MPMNFYPSTVAQWQNARSAHPFNHFSLLDEYRKTRFIFLRYVVVNAVRRRLTMKSSSRRGTTFIVLLPQKVEKRKTDAGKVLTFSKSNKVSQIYALNIIRHSSQKNSRIDNFEEKIFWHQTIF